MNILVLTPDAVGSTLLQRLITIQMQFHDFDRPVINLHELANGIIKYWSPEFNREILGKQEKNKWGYWQSLLEIVEILESVDHYKVARLAESHIQTRQDTLADQLPFYRYLDENFYVISCRRRNVFEYAISRCINRITKKPNVYDAYDKLNTFYDIYQKPVFIQPEIMLEACNLYKNYVYWCQRHFNVASIFYYDRELGRIEDYILDLPIFASQQKYRWRDVFGISFQEWNRCHYYGSDLGGLLNRERDALQLCAPDTIETLGDDAFPLIKYLSAEQQKFIKTHKEKYNIACENLNHMHKLGIIATGVPIKKQTLREKMHMIDNFNELLAVYNEWAIDHPDISDRVDCEKIQSQLVLEYQQWMAPLLDHDKNENHLII